MSALAFSRLRAPAAPVDVARLRNRMADAIERLIAAMDALDPDPELEEDEHGGDVLDEFHDEEAMEDDHCA